MTSTLTATHSSLFITIHGTLVVICHARKRRCALCITFTHRPTVKFIPGWRQKKPPAVASI